MRKEYCRPLVILQELEIEKEIALNPSANAADWNNIDYDSWEELFK